MFTRFVPWRIGRVHGRADTPTAGRKSSRGSVTGSAASMSKTTMRHEYLQLVSHRGGDSNFMPHLPLLRVNAGAGGLIACLAVAAAPETCDADPSSRAGSRKGPGCRTCPGLEPGPLQTPEFGTVPAQARDKV